jgi:hypothetical protein
MKDFLKNCGKAAAPAARTGVQVAAMIAPVIAVLVVASWFTKK